MAVIWTCLVVAAFISVCALFSYGFLHSSQRSCSSLSEQYFFASQKETVSRDLILFAIGLLCLSLLA